MEDITNQSLFSNSYQQQSLQEDLKGGYLNSKKIPDGMHPIYLQAQLYKVANKEGKTPISCAVSLITNLKNEPDNLTLEDLKKNNRIGLINVENGKINSLLLAKEQLQMLKDNQVETIAFKVYNKLLLIEEQVQVESFSSDKDYQEFSNLLFTK